MKDLFTEIAESIRRNKLRTCLTGFAVSWGIFMLIVLLGAGNGVFNAFLSDGEGFITNTMTVGGGVTSKPYDGLQQGRAISLTEEDMELLKAGDFADYVDKVTTSATRSGYTLTYGKRNFDNVTMTGTFPGDAPMDGVKIITGRFINENDIEQRRKVVVIHHLYARNFLSGGTDYSRVLGRKVKIGNMSFTVVGVREAAENTDDRAIYVPYSTMKTIFAMDNKVGQISFSFHGLETEEQNEAFEDMLKTRLNSVHRAAPDDNSAVWISNRFLQNMQMNNVRKLLSKGLWILGLLTLLGGIVGVSNIMLITVKERTHEFGIRKAIGAKPWSIMKLIVAESVSITAIFGYFGMLLGLMACEILDRTMGRSSIDVFGQSIQVFKNPSVEMGTAIGATIVLIVAGTLAGLVPALKAAKVKPIEALRAE